MHCVGNILMTSYQISVAGSTSSRTDRLDFNFFFHSFLCKVTDQASDFLVSRFDCHFDCQFIYDLQAGKGRTGLMVCSYLVYGGMSSEDALQLYAQRRTTNNEGVGQFKHCFPIYVLQLVLLPIVRPRNVTRKLTETR